MSVLSISFWREWKVCERTRQKTRGVSDFLTAFVRDVGAPNKKMIKGMER